MAHEVTSEDLHRAVRYIRIGLPDFAPDVAKALGIVCGALEQAAKDAEAREDDSEGSAAIKAGHNW